MDEDREQEESDEDEAYEREDEMDEVAEQFEIGEQENDDTELADITLEREDSDEESDDCEGGAILSITKHCSHIFAPSSMLFIPMPADPAEKKKALLNPFLFFMRYAYLDTGCKIDVDDIIVHFPNNLWWSMFTEDETSSMVEAQEKRFIESILAGLLQVMTQWLAIPGYPAIPESRIEIELAKTKERSIQRTEYFKSFLGYRSGQTDGWIMTVFEVFRPAMGYELDDLPIDRDGWASFLATLAEVYFFQVLIARAELQLIGSESIQNLIDDVLADREAR